MQARIEATEEATGHIPITLTKHILDHSQAPDKTYHTRPSIKEGSTGVGTRLLGLPDRVRYMTPAL